jgi:hypothetical protein
MRRGRRAASLAGSLADAFDRMADSRFHSRDHLAEVVAI